TMLGVIGKVRHRLVERLEPAAVIAVLELELAEAAQQGQLEIIAAPGEAQSVQRLDRLTAGQHAALEVGEAARQQGARPRRPVVAADELVDDDARLRRLAGELQRAGREQLGGGAIAGAWRVLEDEREIAAGILLLTDVQ